MSSAQRSDPPVIDVARDVPTTDADIGVLRRLRRETPSWLLLPTDVIESLIPAGALDRRPATPPHAQPFTLP